MFVENKSKDTNIAMKSIEDIENPVSKKYVQSKDDEKKVWFVATRKQEMASKRTVKDKFWKQYVKQYEALFVPYTDGRSASNVPLERAIVELFVAEAIKRPTNFNFNGWVWFEYQSRVLEKVWKYEWSVNKRDSEILENE